MDFLPHPNLAGKHAFLSASKYHWVNYSDEKLLLSYETARAAAMGTRLHEFAAEAIRLGIRQQRSRKTLNMYINDAIGFRMSPEVVLRYSDNAFGTADTISFRDDFLRVHDLKTGVTPASVKQLEIYVAFFLLEYKIKYSEIQCETRLYQNDGVVRHVPDIDDILHIMDRIITFDKFIESVKAEAI